MIFVVTCITKENPDKPIDLIVRHHSGHLLRRYFEEHGTRHVPGFQRALIRLHPKMLIGQEHEITVDLDLSSTSHTSTH